MTFVVLVTIAMCGFNFWWYGAYRRGLPMHIDESGYTAFGLTLAHAFQRGGLSGLFHAFETDQAVFGPLVPLLTAPVDLVAGEHIVNGYVVVLLFYFVLVVGTYAIARRFLSPRYAALAAVLVATAPAVLTFARAYYFAVPAAAVVTAAIWCLLKSEALTRSAWVLAAGALLGLAVLTRTHLLAVVPCVFGAAFVQIVVAGRDVRARVLRLVGGALLATAIAAVWYVRNFGDAVGYLRGTRFQVPMPAPDRYRVVPVLRLLTQLVDLTELPMAVVLVSVGAAAGVLAWRRRDRSVPHQRPMSTRHLDLVFLGLVAGSIVVLYAVTEFASGQYPIGEWLVLAPIMMTAAVAGVAALPTRARGPIVSIVTAMAVLNVAMLSGLAPALAEVRTVPAGPFGSLTVTDGRQFLQTLVQAGPPGHLPASFKALRPLQRRITVWAIRYAANAGEQPVVFVAGGESRYLNINDFLLADRLLEQRGRVLVGRVDLVSAAPLRDYCQWLDDPRRGLPNFVMTHRRGGSGHVRPLPIAAEERVRVLGYRVVRTVDLPDGPTFIWWRPQAKVPSSCPSPTGSRSRRASAAAASSRRP